MNKQPSDHSPHWPQCFAASDPKTKNKNKTLLIQYFRAFSFNYEKPNQQAAYCSHTTCKYLLITVISLNCYRLSQRVNTVIFQMCPVKYLHRKLTLIMKRHWIWPSNTSHVKLLDFRHLFAELLFNSHGIPECRLLISLRTLGNCLFPYTKF